MIYIMRLKLTTSRISTWQYHEYIIRYCTTCIWTKFYNYWNTLRSNCYGRVLRLSIPNWLRRLITRGLVIPVIICLIVFKGNENKMEQLLVLSQVFLSIALPFSLIPLQLATSNKN